VSAAALDQVSTEVLVVRRAKRGRATSVTSQLTEKPAVKLRVCGDDDDDDDGGWCMSPVRCDRQCMQERRG
jgi:hypothetical protein